MSVKGSFQYREEVREFVKSMVVATMGHVIQLSDESIKEVTDNYIEIAETVIDRINDYQDGGGDDKNIDEMDLEDLRVFCHQFGYSDFAQLTSEEEIKTKLRAEIGLDKDGNFDEWEEVEEAEEV